ncbi:zinc-finger domain-containing protein [Paenibacillus sp. JJ1722]|uniref:zinc-finger domain-containing protein n=1 Tax=Paenibacillus sp. JJ1722 TaxID=3398770 RepID=UPI003AB02E00
MNRIDAIIAIGDLLEQKCSGCPTRDEFNRKYGSVTSKLDKHCKMNCPVGKQLQDYGRQLSRKGDGNGANNLCSRSQPEAPCRAGQRCSVLAPERDPAAKVPQLA